MEHPTIRARELRRYGLIEEAAQRRQLAEVAGDRPGAAWRAAATQAALQAARWRERALTLATWGRAAFHRPASDGRRWV